MTGSAFALFGLGMAAMRSVKPEQCEHRLPELKIEPIATDELLLETAFAVPLLLEDVFDDGTLLLDDVLAQPVAESRVVQLFATQPASTPGELKARIDSHLAGSPRFRPTHAPSPAPDASGALYAALDELRRSLR